jgi:hypothetical protein
VVTPTRQKKKLLWPQSTNTHRQQLTQAVQPRTNCENSTITGHINHTAHATLKNCTMLCSQKCATCATHIHRRHSRHHLQTDTQAISNTRSQHRRAHKATTMIIVQKHPPVLRLLEPQMRSSRRVRATLSASPGAACVAPGPRQAGSPTAPAAAAARLLQLQQTPAYSQQYSEKGGSQQGKNAGRVETQNTQQCHASSG